MPISRRSFLLATASAGLVAAAGQTGLSPAVRRLYVHVAGGWDPRLVFDLDHPAAGSRVNSSGPLAFVDHPSRPQVRAFVRQHGARCAVVNAVDCGDLSHALPLGLRAGEHVASEQLNPLLEAHSVAGLPLANAAGAALSEAIRRGEPLADGTVLTHTGAGDAQWDSHRDSDGQQSACFEDLFGLLGQLAAHTDRNGQRLLATTEVIVFSELGRSAGFNRHGGTEHHRFTSVLRFGAGVRSGHQGRFDDLLNPRGATTSLDALLA